MFSLTQAMSLSSWQRRQASSRVRFSGMRTGRILKSWGGCEASSTSPGLWHSVQGSGGWEKSNLWSWML